MKMVGCNLRRHCIAINVRVRPIIDKSLSYTGVQLLNSIKHGAGVAPGPGYLVTKCDECDARTLLADMARADGAKRCRNPASCGSLATPGGYFRELHNEKSARRRFLKRGDTGLLASHHTNHLQALVRVAPLVVVPGHDLHERAVQSDTCVSGPAGPV